MTQKQMFSNYHPPTYEACNIILLNMKNHYRRLYTVKPAVDTSPPESYKLLSRKTNRSLSCLDLSLSDIPSYKFHQGPEAMKNETSCSHESQRNIRPIIKRHSCINEDKNLNHHSRSKSRIKSAVSREQKSSSSILVNSDASKDFSLKEKLLYNSGKTGSVSSQDSAYNEGEVGSSERGSRTPTPETIVNNPSKSPNVPLSSATYRRKVNNYLYLKFLTDITDEILKKGVVTNKALKRIFQDHLDANCHHLNQNRMLLELETLCEKLGVPENDSLNSADFGLGSGKGSPNCLPLFREEDANSEENYEKFSSNKSKSVCKKGLTTAKNSIGPDMLEAFTTLSENKKLIDTIQASLKNATTNFHRVSALSSQFLPVEDKLGRKSLDFEYGSPRQVSESKIFLEENAAINNSLKTSCVNSPTPINVNTNQQRRLSSNFNYDPLQKVSEKRLSSLDKTTCDNQQPESSENHQSPSNTGTNHQRKSSLSDENIFENQEKISPVNCPSPKSSDMNQQTKPSSGKNSAVIPEETSAINSQSSNSADGSPQKKVLLDADYEVSEESLVNNQHGTSIMSCQSSNSADVNKESRAMTVGDLSAFDSSAEISMVNSRSLNDMDIDPLRRPSLDVRCDTPHESSEGRLSASGRSTDVSIGKNSHDDSF